MTENNNNNPNTDDSVDQSQNQNEPTTKHSVSDAEAKLIKEVMEKKAQIKEQTEKLAFLQKTIEGFGGVDAIKALIDEKAQAEAAKKEAEKEALEKKGEWEKLKAQMADEHVKATEAFKTQVSELTAKLKGEEAKIAELTVGAAFGSSEYISSKTILPGAKARALYGSYFDIAEDGSVIGYDKPRGSAGRTALVDQLGNNLGFEAAIAKIIEADPDHESLMRAQTSRGSGSGSTGMPHTNKTTSEKPRSGLEMIAAALSKK